jgi:hypothetical protein
MKRREFLTKGLGALVTGVAATLLPSSTYAHPHEGGNPVWRMEKAIGVQCYEQKTINVHVSDPTFDGFFNENMGMRIVSDTLKKLGYTPFTVKTKKTTPPYTNPGMGLITLNYESGTLSMRLRDADGKKVGVDFDELWTPEGSGGSGFYKKSLDELKPGARNVNLENVLRRIVPPACSYLPQKTIPTKDEDDCEDIRREWKQLKSPPWDLDRIPTKGNNDCEEIQRKLKQHKSRPWGLGRIPAGGKE